jgi:tRNA (Thr-GGU) A37 N-methylase
MDMLDGTPLLDIKRFVPQFDHRNNVRVGRMEGPLRDATSRKVSDDRY